MKNWVLSLTLISALVVSSCSGGGGGSSTPSSSSTKITLTGTVDSQATSASGASSNPVKGAAVNIVDATGNAQTVYTDSSGNYSAQVSKLTMYGVSVGVPSSKPSERALGITVKIKALAQVGSDNLILNVNAGSTAAVLVIQKKYAITLGEANVSIGTKLDDIDINATVVKIYASSKFNSLALAVADDVKKGTDPSTDDLVVTPLVQDVITAVVVVPNTNVCPTGQTLISGVCTTPPVTSCPAGQTLTNGVCTTTPVTSCPSGQTLVNGVCTTTGGTTSLNDPALVGTWVGSGNAAGVTMVFTATSLSMTGGLCPQTGSYTTSLNTAVAFTVTTASTSCPAAGGLGGFTYSVSGTTLTLTWFDDNKTTYQLTKQTTSGSPLVGSWRAETWAGTGQSLWNSWPYNVITTFSADGTWSSTGLTANWVNGVSPTTTCSQGGTWTATTTTLNITFLIDTCDTTSMAGTNWPSVGFTISGSALTLSMPNGVNTLVSQSSAPSNDPALVGTWKPISPSSYVFTATTVNNPGCPDQGLSYTTNTTTSTISLTVTTASANSNCQAAVGTVLADFYTYSISGTTLSLSWNSPPYSFTGTNPNSNGTSLIGTWTDNMAVTFTANSITKTGGDNCPGEISSYMTSGNTISTTVVTASAVSGCSAVGSTSAATYGISGATLTLTPSSGTVTAGGNGSKVITLTK